MKRKRKNIPSQHVKIDVPDYPYYPQSEDIYSQYDRVGKVNPIDTLADITENDKLEIISEKDLINPTLGSDLDVPASELDDVQERIGSEDEENNYYSIGGDNHDNLEESNV